MLLIRKRAEWQRAYANKQPLLISLLKETFLTAKRVSKMVIITKALAGWWWGKKRAGQELRLKSFGDSPGRHRIPRSETASGWATVSASSLPSGKDRILS